MSKLRILSGKEVCDILEANDFMEIRRRGSHIVMQRRLENSTMTVPVPHHDVIQKGTLSSIIRQSGLPRTVFES